MRACVPACVCALQSDELFTTEASTEDLRNLRKELEESRYGEGCFVLWARLSAAGQQCRGTAVSGVACLRALSRKSSSSLPQDASAARARASRPGHDHVQLTENQGLDPQRESPRGLGMRVKEKADGSVYINYMQKEGAAAAADPFLKVGDRVLSIGMALSNLPEFSRSAHIVTTHIQ